MTMTQVKDALPEVIRLQLRKPKSWDWQLSTSKSSPQISLPIIQLYNSKGKLLVEAIDNGDTQRRIWRGSGIQDTELPTDANKDSRESSARRLKRSRSDTLSYNSSGNILRNKHESINRKDRNRQPNNKIKSFDESLDNSVTGKPADIVHENRKSRTNSTKVINENGKNVRENPYNCLMKSKSDVLERKDNMLPSKHTALKRSSTSFREFLQNAEARRNRRSGSDDVLRRKLGYNEESLKRAEMDGYRNFITPNIPQDKSQEKSNKNVKVLMSAENILFGNNTSNIEVNDFKPTKYRTRTSSAGTLIISEESFSNAPRRRRRRDAGDWDESVRDARLRATNAQANARNSDVVVENIGTTKHIRQASDPTDSKSRKYAFNRYPGMDRKNDIYKPRESHKMKEKINNPCAGLFYSRSDVFPFNEILNDKIDKNVNDNCNHIVQKLTIPSESRKNSDTVIEKLSQEKPRKVHRRLSDGSMSSNTIEKGNRTKGHLINDHSTPKSSGGGDSDLLQLVRRLSSNDHVKMGANVSRHSAKGLSGRRSQSSGSICNGKGRHADGKICSSLPSYLDERESNGCNNNHHECEKPPIDEVDRIPPLGDGAPLHWKFSDTQTALCDQGYGSERSPEEEYPPPLPDHDQQCHHHLEPHACYPFITPDSTFTVKLTKGTRGLGLSVTGGIDSTGSWPGLIRIKRLFPHQPALACGLLNVGDLLLEANGITLTGLTNYEALEVLRTAPNQVDLKICRPPPDVLNCVSPISEVPPPPPRREPPSSLNLPSAIYSTPEDDYYHGEFEVTLKKIQGSLGFTLRKEDDSALGHYVRALVREPALTDGRIRAGDKIIAVNDVEISPMTHEEAVQFLRQCSEIVRLRLYRDSAQTPVAALSPSETTPRTSFSRKAHLRQEAVDMLNDIAVRKLIPGNQDNYRRSLSPNASPRRLRRHPCPSDASHITDSSTKYMINDEQFHEGLLQQCSHPFDDDAFNSLFSIESDDGDKPSRPSSLDLYNPNQTPVAARKPRFNFSLAHNAYELNNLDPEVLDAPNLTYNLGNDDVKSTDVECGDSFPQEPASMPHIPIDNSAFSYKNPAYQSAHPQIGSDTVDYAVTTKTKSDDTNMKKWKNIVLQDEEETTPIIDIRQTPMKEKYEVLAIELNRGWNSRLGFSLQGAAGVTYVSAVHADSVAAKDGRLKPGDCVIKVNDETVEHLTTSEIIDLLRIVRGPVCIVVSRVKSTEDCPQSNAEN